MSGWIQRSFPGSGANRRSVAPCTADFQRRDGAEADPFPAIGVAFDDIAILGLVTTGVPDLATG